MNIQGLKFRCEVQQQIIRKWKKHCELQEKLLRRALLVIKVDEDTKLMSDILKAIVPDVIE